MATPKKTFASDDGRVVINDPVLLVQHINRALKSARKFKAPAEFMAAINVLKQDTMRKRDGNQCRAQWLIRLRLARALAIIAVSRILHNADSSQEQLILANYSLTVADLLERSIRELTEKFGESSINTDNFAGLLVGHSPHLLEVTQVDAEQYASELAALGLLAD